MKPIDEVLITPERVLNPGAHRGDSPLYEHEVLKADCETRTRPGLNARC